MTEENMKKLYDWFIESGQLERAEEILAIPRYAKFKEISEETEEEPKRGRPKKGG